MSHIDLPLQKGLSWPDYDHSIVNLVCTLLNYFGVTPGHSVLPGLDRRLKERQYKNVVLFVCDGMGARNLELALPQESFLRSHMHDTLTSVFPATTVAATTSLESGLTPAEHGWPGWNAYFKELDRVVNLFPNTTTDGLPAADYSVTEKYLPYRSVYEQINAAGCAAANSISPFGTLYAPTLEEICDTVVRQCEQPKPQYLYCYWTEPDHTMHEYGITAPAAIEWIRRLNHDLEMLSRRLTDTLLIVTADHGHMNGKNLAVSDIPGLKEVLRTEISIEPRAVSCLIRNGQHKVFEKIYREHLQDKFLLLSKEEILRYQIFGPGTMHPKFPGFIGDYMLISTSDWCLFQTTEERDFFAGVHAGLLDTEMYVPLILADAK